MPGAFAQITLFNRFRDSRRLEAIPNFPTVIISGILKDFRYCELGGVSPD